jgi:hypothetical protein
MTEFNVHYMKPVLNFFERWPDDGLMTETGHQSVKIIKYCCV